MKLEAAHEVLGLAMTAAQIGTTASPHHRIVSCGDATGRVHYPSLCWVWPASSAAAGRGKNISGVVQCAFCRSV